MSGGGFYASLDASKGSENGAGEQAKAAGDAALPKSLKRKLGVLQYPDLESAGLSSPEYCKIILWLEEEKIRLYEKADRKKLRDFSDEAWYRHVSVYAKELGVPSPEGLSEKDLTTKLRVLNALTNVAIHDVYRDKAESKEVTMTAPSKPVSGGGEGKQQLRDLVEPLNRLLKLWGLPQLTQDAIDTDTIAALRCVRTRLCAPAKPGPSVNLDVDELPTGFESSDPEVTRAASILRLLHGIELGQLQVNINHVVNELQELTADPKTDSKLGKVGT
eukprot:CAMPEP_0171176744 /NCGR_PEP_ID=MMETSP0790-20130122/11890_1 /TAXON_ID=2925 /ORGANISM="Alexandrium catenella, Strain OF101" /LENGTH=274 /DNA_ID=CAMNT_0011641637 /DNA_START=72 /DNA_END=896 /DNA_ORIENTATION=-